MQCNTEWKLGTATYYCTKELGHDGGCENSCINIDDLWRIKTDYAALEAKYQRLVGVVEDPNVPCSDGCKIGRCAECGGYQASMVHVPSAYDVYNNQRTHEFKPAGRVNIKPCPCGKTPEKLIISEGSTHRWRYVSGDCGCGWETEARIITYNQPEGYDEYTDCVEAWNELPRATHHDEG